MKSIFILLALFIVSLSAHAYVSQQGTDPSLSPEIETKSVQKSSTALYSDAITSGDPVSYDVGNSPTGAYVVTKNGPISHSAADRGLTQKAADLIAGFAQRAVATGDTSLFSVVVRGYVTAAYDADVNGAIATGTSLCIGGLASTRGKLLACDSGVISPIISLENKASGTGSALKVLIKSK